MAVKQVVEGCCTRLKLVLVAAWLAAGWYVPAKAADPVDADNLRPGLITTLRDLTKPVPVEIVRLEPTVALACKAGEAPHPRLAAGGGTVRWEGYLNVLRAGAYRFRVVLRGQFRLRIAGKDVLAAEVKEDAATLKEGPEVRLEAGVQPLVAEFTRLPGSARVELLWQAGHFRQEPLPYDHVGHLPNKVPARLEADARSEHGRFLAEEYACASCHRPSDRDHLAKGLLARQGPDLSQIGARTYAGWLYQWLESPQRLRPGAVMPQLFDDNEAGRVERYAVTRYLVALGGPFKPKPPPANPKDVQASVLRGQTLFSSTGCIACHSETSTRHWSLTALGSKTTADKLSAFLLNPLAVDPSGRMPNLLLQPKEADDLARYLCQSRDATIDADLPAAPNKDAIAAAFRRLELRADERLSGDEQLLDLGKRLVISKQCTQCHTVAPGGKPLASVAASSSFDSLKDMRQHETGCLTNDAAKRGQAPWFGLSDDQRKALRQFLAEGTAGAGSIAPAYAAQAALKRFNCLACHSRDGDGGLAPNLVEELRRVEKVENAEALLPPSLTGVGHKLRTPWLREVLVNKGRARPWMGLRMPQFGEAHVGYLPEALAALEGTEPDDQVHKVSLTAAKLEAGRFLAGKGAFGCISCHDLAGIPNTGTRGPDLAGMSQRVRYEWYLRWLEQPQRLEPGTRMPAVFSGGKTQMDNVLNGSAGAQAEAIWGYLALGPTLPLPDGMEPPRGLVLTVKDRPYLLRTFLPEAGTRAIAVGYPGGVSLAFDAQRGRLAYAWSGNFLDASPVWNDRGGNPAKVLGTRFFTSPPGCPWGATDNDEPPDFAARAKDPAYGALPPDGKVYAGPQRLRFIGYTTDKAGLPAFHYVVDPDASQALEVSEQPAPLRSAGGVGVLRRFALAVPAQQTSWLLAGETTQEPRLLDRQAAPVKLDLKAGKVEVAATGHLLVLPQGGDRLAVVAAATVPDGTRWQLRRVGGTWQALLRLPKPAAAGKVEIAVQVWAPYRDEPALLKELVGVK
jgi:mono/diheme cytochrome c family protein